MSELIEKFTPHRIRQERSDGTSKMRNLMVPSEETRTEHREMLRFLYGLDIPMPHATGGMPGMELRDNILPHRQSDHFYMVDLKDAFLQVDINELLAIINSPLIPQVAQSDIEAFILEWATSPDAPGLPLGAPCSPFLFNLYCTAMDKKIAAHCEDRSIVYTRYLDDLTFSSKAKLGKKRRKKLNGIIEDVPGMSINHAKSRVHSIEKGPVTITGISLYPDRRISASPQVLEKARNVFEYASLGQAIGEAPDEEELGRVNGYHGAIHQLTDGETPLIRRFDQQYRRALGKTSFNSSEII